MPKVFAALIFLCLILGCLKTYFQKSFPLQALTEKEIIYSAPGDFDGDGKSENIYILKSPEEKLYLKLKCINNTYEAKLNLDIKNFSAWIEDVDGNNRDDLIISSISDDIQSLYVFIYDKDIKLLISPKIIESKINLKNIIPYANNSNPTNRKSSKDSNTNQAILVCTDIDLFPGESLFTCDYIMPNHNNSADYISVSFTINSDGIIRIENVSDK